MNPQYLIDNQTSDALSFTAKLPGGRTDLWSHDIRGDWSESCAAGRKFGREATDYIRATNDAALLSGIVRTIAERGTIGGVEVGFFAALSASLAASGGPNLAAS